MLLWTLNVALSPVLAKIFPIKPLILHTIPCKEDQQKVEISICQNVHLKNLQTNLITSCITFSIWIPSRSCVSICFNTVTGSSSVLTSGMIFTKVHPFCNSALIRFFLPLNKKVLFRGIYAVKWKDEGKKKKEKLACISLSCTSWHKF